MSTKAKMGVLPAGSVPPVTTLKKGINILEMVKTDNNDPEWIYCYIKFPDGFIKTFQVNKIEDLTAQISLQLRGRYGLKAINYTKVPKKIETGNKVEITVE